MNPSLDIQITTCLMDGILKSLCRGINSTPNKVDVETVKPKKSFKEMDYFIDGEDAPSALKTFDELFKKYYNDSNILNGLNSLNYTEPFPIQTIVVPIMMELRNCLICSPTGSGKTLSYVIPTLLHASKSKGCKSNSLGIKSIIIAPNRHLIEQIYKEFLVVAQFTNITVQILKNSEVLNNNSSVLKNIQSDILITTPKRLCLLLKQKDNVIKKLIEKLTYVVLDECDLLFLNKENGFLRNIARIYNYLNGKDVRWALFSATLGNDIELWTESHLNKYISILVGKRNCTVNTVKQEIKFVGQKTGKLIALMDILRQGLNPPILIFVATAKNAQRLHLELSDTPFKVDYIHADQSDDQRNQTIKQFRCGQIWILITTDILSRGIDFKGIKTVINYDIPSSSINYIHRIGRTGRSGQTGHAITFFTEKECLSAKKICEVMKESDCEVPNWLESYDSTNNFHRKSNSRMKPFVAT